MANWKKVLVSGSEIAVTGISASNIPTSGGTGDRVLVIDGTDGAFKSVTQGSIQGVTTAVFQITGSYGVLDGSVKSDTTFTISANSTDGVNGDYINIPTTTGGSGTGLTLNFTVAGGSVDDSSIVVNHGGSGYAETDVITIASGEISAGDNVTLGALAANDIIRDGAVDFDATGDSLIFSSSKGDVNITVSSASVNDAFSVDVNFANNVVSGAAQIASAISGAHGAISGNLYTTSQSLETLTTAYTGISASYALSESILGTANEIKVTGTGENDITIGLPVDVHISGNTEITGSLIVSKSITADTLTLLGLSLIDNNAAVISGSNIFGDAVTDFHQFTGSVSIGGGITGSTIPTDNSRVVKDLLAVTSDGHFVKVGTNIHNAISGAFNEASGALSSSVSLVSGNLSIVSGGVVTLTAASSSTGTNINTLSGSLAAISGNLYNTSRSLETISSSVNTLTIGSSSAGSTLTTISSSFSITSQSLESVSSSVFNVSAAMSANSGALQNLGSITGDVTGSHVSMSVVGVQGVSLTAAEVSQMANIDNVTIGNSAWAHLGNLDQDVSQDGNPTFNSITVTSGVTNIQTSNLNVSDRFILLNSHSANPADQYTPADGGIIVQLSGSIAEDRDKYGTAFYYDNDNSRWALVSSASNAVHDATSLTPDSFVVSISQSAGVPSGTPEGFGNSVAGDSSYYGMMYVNTTAGDDGGLYIYLPD